MMAEYDEYGEPLSRSEMKRRMTALQDLGKRLAERSPDELARMELDPALLDAIQEYQTMTKHEARRRQMQYIGRLMRDVDTEHAQEVLGALEAAHESATGMFHDLEDLRGRLLEGDEQAMQEAFDMIPPMERGELSNRLRSLVRAAQKERAAQKPPKAYRNLFRFLRELAERPADAG